MTDEVTKSLDLMKAAQGGDGAALNRLLQRYYERVRRIVRARLGQRLRTRMESGDILQDVFLTACRTFDRFEVTDEASLIGWLARITERQIHDAADKHGARKRSAEREVALDKPGDDGGSIEVPDTTPPPSDLLARLEDAAIVDECLAELPDLYRELILHRDFMGMSWEQVAEVTQRPSAAAARMMHGQALIELTKRVKKRSSSAR
jgi:RNA polymerase sigma-70 factor (ECF subfamily)